MDGDKQRWGRGKKRKMRQGWGQVGLGTGQKEMRKGWGQGKKGNEAGMGTRRVGDREKEEMRQGWGQAGMGMMENRE